MTQADSPELGKKNKPGLMRRLFLGGGIIAIVLEVGLVVLMLGVLALGALIWRVNAAPLDIGFAKDYVENALYDEKTGIHVNIDSVVLHWPDLQDALLLGIDGARILNANDGIILSVGELDLALSKRRLILGQIQPKAIILKNPSLRLRRTAENTIDFGLDAFKSPAPEKAPSRTPGLDTLFQIIPRPGDESLKDTPLAMLKEFRIENARAIIEDHKFGASWYFPSTDISLQSASEGIHAAFKMGFPAVHNEPAQIHTDIMIGWDSHDIQVKAFMQNFDLRVFSNKIPDFDVLGDQDIVLNGSMEAKFNADLSLEAMQFKMLSPAGNLDIPELSPDEVPYKDLNFDLTYASASDGQKTLSLNDLSVNIKDVIIRAKAHILDSKNENGRSLAGPLEVTIADMPHSRIATVWPAALVGDASELWVVKKLSGGNVSGLKATMNVSAMNTPEGGWDFGIAKLMAYFQFTDIKADYRAPLPPLTKAKGSGFFDLDEDRLNISLSQGEMGGLTVTDAKLAFNDIVAEGKGSVAMDIGLEGPLKSVFEYLSTPPIDLKDELDMDLAQVKGSADLRVKLDFPTHADLKIEEIKMDVKGDVRDGNIPDVVKTMDLSGGPFAVAVDNERYTVKGKGKLDGRDVTMEWEEYLKSEGKAYRHKATASIIADEDLRRKMGIDLSDFIKGSVPVDIVYTGLPGGNKAQADVKADMTPADFFVITQAYTKPPGTKGAVSLKANLEGENLSSISNLKIDAPNLALNNGSVGFRNGVLSSVVLPGVAINETRGDVNIDFAASGAMKVLLKGAFLDMRPLLANDDTNAAEYNEPPMVVSVSATKMRTADQEIVTNAKIYADIDNKGRFNQLEMDARAGAGDIYLRYKPDASGKRTFHFEADDAGAALKAFDIYRNIRGGKMVAYAEPIKGVYDRNLVGQAEMTNFRVVNAPSLARLLGALSLGGMIELLGNEGLEFSKMESKFDWLYRPQGSILVLKDGRTSGNSLGLTFDGRFDNGASTVDVSGTIIPMSGVNNIIGSIPLVGDILTGGGAIFAATYTMRGSSEKPDISVNPLSVLAPGIIRRILFE